MNTLRHFAAILLIVSNLFPTESQAQSNCATAIEIDASLAAGESATGSAYGNIELTTLEASLDWNNSPLDASWPSDATIYITDPNGNCVVWGGSNIVANGCEIIQNTQGIDWPVEWNTTASGSFTATIDLSDSGLSGSGDWTIEIVNGWATSDGAVWDFALTLSGPSVGQCPDPEACNYVPEEEQIIPLDEVCLYPEDLYGIGFDCDGVCLGDADGDGICDEEDTCFGDIDECGVCNGTSVAGCNDPEACNFNPEANCDDGSCLFLDACGVCGGSGVAGCNDPEACNYSDLANCDDGSCLFGESGCTNPNACNFSCEAVCDDGSCLYGGFGCTDLTASNYDSSAACDDGGCYYAPSPEVYCGYGTVWKASIGRCVPVPNADVDFSGCVGMTDLLELLAAFGTCQEWQCGAPLEYQGHSYATVPIGEQCWFAENLRNELYLNGDSIPAYLNDEEWANTSSGAVAVFGEGSSACGNFSFDGDACDEAWSLNEYGRLYNWHAVDDTRGLCPSGWHVPTHWEWMTMEMALGMSESEANALYFRGTNQGMQMKTTYGWRDGGNGTNSSGFSGLPGGYRETNGNFTRTGLSGYWWSSSAYYYSDSSAHFRQLLNSSTSVYHWWRDARRGFSVRCIQDALEIPGCTDSSACNYAATATMDDGSCAELDCAGACGGDAELDVCGVCNGPGDIYECGCFDIPEGDCDCEGNQLDEFGVCGGSASGEFQCNAPVNYQGYDYATVLIGEQCWFAENLRNKLYLNGDSIPANLSNDEWGNTSLGAAAVYGEGSSDCYENSPNGDACEEAWSLNEYGRLYNFYAVSDDRGLCPSGWHVPSDGEWITMEMALGMSESEANETGYRGTDQGTQMKTYDSWYAGGNGTNSSGFSGLPGGQRYVSGNFGSAGVHGYWWSSSPNGAQPWYRYLFYNIEVVSRLDGSPQEGLSVRCVQNSEE